ncbi:CaiB/BaiF CoA transferase family protein [Nocardioides nematodiphilus]|uniref:CaiB/BaiF CoA transferase family protein n=1 Tax=Nocardioides nematodiphilus TaxID=2849669 RepID=UPI001CDA41D7|nr:CoA transferase [Nocardioides nematodiphilus]MCA1983234.1 CoA transferase [Nocardioides nematodiphilus]
MSAPGSLTGLRVVEIGTSVAAPFGTQILGDMGAEVIKVERLGSGDDTRSWNPPSWSGESIAFMSFNRNKRSLALDYKTVEGQEVLRKLVTSADVLVQNLRPGALAKAGFSVEELRALNPRLIIADLSGFGHTGPRAAQPAYDPLLQAYSGIVSITGEDGGDPVRVPVSLLDMGTGMWMAISVYEALRRRDASGVGSHVQLSLLQTALTWMTSPMIGQAAGNPAPARLGSGFRGVVPYGAFPTADGHVFISAGNDALWRRLLGAIGALDLDERPGFKTNPERNERRAEVTAALSERTSAFGLDEIVGLLEAAGVPHSPVNTVDRVFRDPQVQAIGMMQPLPHPVVDDLQVVNLPMTFDGDYPELRTAPPVLGEGAAEVLASLGFSEADVAALAAENVIELPE